MGRPTTYSDELVTEICALIAEGRSLRSICDSEGMPGIRTVFGWLADESHADFRTKYAHAREVQADTLVDEMIDIADDGRNDWMEKLASDGSGHKGWRENGEALKRSDIRIKTRQWVAEKLKPKKYGSKVAVGGSSDMDPIKTEDAGGYDLARRIAFALAANDKSAG